MNIDTKNHRKMLLISLISIFVASSCHEITQLKVPLYADPRRAAELSCHFRMDDQKLHSVKLYRDTNEIFRYIPSQKTPIRLHNVTGVTVQGGECQMDACVVNVMPLPVADRSTYTCEVSTEGPKFLIARQTKHMTVVAIPDEDPTIVGAPKVVNPGEQLTFNCSTDYSLPPSNITWYIDNEQQKPEPWQKTELSSPVTGGLRKSWQIMRYRVPTTSTGALRVRCESVLPVEPPAVRDTEVVITVRSKTELLKYISGANRTSNNLLSITLLLFLKDYIAFRLFN